MLKTDYPKTLTLGKTKYILRLMDADDRNAILAMAQRLSEDDLLFLRRDITQPAMVDEWINDLLTNRAITILAEDDGQLVAYGSVYYNQLYWNRHLAEIRFLVSSPYRNRGLGTRITHELMTIAKQIDVDKVVTYMAVEDKSAQRVVEDLGFRPEAILTDWVKTRDDRTHDLLIMSIALDGLQS
ncbi:MAG: GNAT family N-acetyltransferase [Chloroflexi bacterium]|nr:GNAT family N-acetyltransferase [Chloroflexota bacterium]